MSISSVHCPPAKTDMPQSRLPAFVYFPGDGVEDLEVYRAGGYHPTHIGDEFSAGRYRVVHKLGFGSFSTVWLAHDRQKNRYVALKIIMAEYSEKSTEYQILQRLQKGDVNHPGRHFVSSLLDHFSFEGPNGLHLCLVSEAAGSNIAKIKENSPKFKFPVKASRSIAAQIIMGLAYIHSSGVCHGGINSPSPSQCIT